MTALTVICATKVTYACGNTRIFGMGELVVLTCWCGKGAVKVEKVEELTK